MEKWLKKITAKKLPVEDNASDQAHVSSRKVAEPICLILF